MVKSSDYVYNRESVYIYHLVIIVDQYKLYGGSWITLIQAKGHAEPLCKHLDLYAFT